MITQRSQPQQLEIERVPWSTLGTEFVAQWGRPRGKTQPEHMEILGPTGSGKSMFQRQILLDRARRRGSHIIIIATKAADQTMVDMGWPIVDTWHEVRKNPQCVYWPRTSKIGEEREAYQAAKIEDLLDRLWQPNSNTIIVFDEFVYIEGLSRRLRSIMNMYVREGRSHGITCVMGKQRPQGTQRDMHSESDWKIAFKMNDQDDNERLAQLFGSKRAWIPVIDSLRRDKFEFLIQHKLTGATYISWVDNPAKVEKKG